MNLNTLIPIVILTVVFAEASILKKKSLISPMSPDRCYTCKMGDKPLAWPIISYMSKLKDTVLRGFSALSDKIKVKKLI
ncbi:hypothetical protein KGM_212761 [Danaus plexippus plexippus]|uniref:Uncharacterized protein n=1 Tax=Danaus plexippus plexippus TaxID=278856 RepID=A0A212F289_DANPL|nr:hypothetical protein KGM_212761 [Danaus plexippus plexippus]